MNQGPTIEQSWTRRAGRGSGDAPVPGVVAVFTGGRAVLAAVPLPKEGTLLLGRGQVGDLVLDDECMSRRHAEVSLGPDGWVVRDLGSRNGSALDGVSLHGERRASEARVLRVGDTLFVLERDVRPFVEGGVQEDETGAGGSSGAILGPRLRVVWQEIDSAAESGDVLHVTGESGTGKELAARRFHAHGPRAHGPFVGVNCASIPPALAERLLFGAKRGAYSGADADSDGYLQAADRGTLFLDEIVELDAQVQAKLLRVLETREVQPLGATRARKIDFGLCSATHAALRERVAAGRFRQDLFFRLGRPQVSLPPLRERPEEIPWLLERTLRAHDQLPHTSLVEAAMVRRWPGNVRELILEIREAGRVARAAGTPTVEARHLDDEAGGATAPARAAGGAPDAAPPDREAIAETLAREGGNISATARALGVHRTQLRRWMERYGL